MDKYSLDLRRMPASAEPQPIIERQMIRQLA